MLYPAELLALIEFMFLLKWSGRLDLNQRPPAPKAGTLAKLSHAPTLYKFAEYVDYVFIKTKLKYKTGKDFSRKKE